MSNILGEGDRDLVNLDYSSLFNAILEVLKNSQFKPFRISKNGKQLFIDIDAIAYYLATSQRDKIDNPIIGNGYSGKIASVNFSQNSKNVFPEKIRAIKDSLQQHLELVLQENHHNSIEDYLRFIWTPLTDFQGNTSKTISLKYDFNKKYTNLSKQRLTVNQKDNENPLLKFHRLTIIIKDSNNEFDSNLKKSLENYINTEYENDINIREEFIDILDDVYQGRTNRDSEWYKLKNLINQEVIGRVQRTAKIKYLEYLLENTSQHTNSIYLEILINRLKALENYLNDPNLADGDYEVNYGGESYNLRDILSYSYTFDCLPIIPIIEGNIGEVRDNKNEELKFCFGLKIKFGRPIQKEDGKPVLDYNLELIHPDSQIHQETISNDLQKKSFIRKVLQRTVLYFFVFATPKVEFYEPRLDLEYDVVTQFKTNIIPVLKGHDQSKKQSLLSGIVRGINQYQGKEKVEKLRQLITSQINKPRTWDKRSYPININVRNNIINLDEKSNKLFQKDLETKSALRYLSVTDGSLDANSLCSLSGNIHIDEVHYFKTEDDSQFTMEYQIDEETLSIPIIVYPRQDITRSILEKNFLNSKSILFYYSNENLKNIFSGDLDLKKAFIYRTCFSLLADLSLKILLDTATQKLKRKLFIPILRLHLGDKQNPRPEETFMRSNFKIIAHLINQEHRATVQGICVNQTNQYKISNALSSLYSILPKKFVLANTKTIGYAINKLAIVVVSSRECDRSWRGDYKLVNLMGEIIKIDRQKDNSIVIYPSKTISENYNSNIIYQDPDVLVEEVNRLYQEGYRHILYIARSPYSQKLNLTTTEDDDNLYFMSSAVMRNLKANRDDLKIYPVFFDKYYAVKIGDISRKSLYIQDVEELTNIFEDKTKQMAIFFNLFNGITVGNQDRYYNGVISYSTLLNRYDDTILDTSEILAGLIDRDRGLKEEILELLTLFHFSRYEAEQFGNRSIQIKLDPYENMIGDDSVGKLSILPHIQDKIQFNLMAFLNEVEDALMYGNIDNQL